MRWFPVSCYMMIRQGLDDHRHGLFALWRRWSLKVQLVSFSANLANNITVLFGGHAQNLQFLTPQETLTEQNKVATRVCH